MVWRSTITTVILAVVIPMTGCPPENSYGFQAGLWHLTFAEEHMTFGVNFTGGVDSNLGYPVDVGFGKLPGIFFWSVKNNVVTMEHVVNGQTTHTYSGTMSSHYQMDGNWQEVGNAYVGQWSAIHSDPLPLEEEE
jgi:hypothetical protein